ncbi:hypothetical protein DFH11DRAFT_1514361 [Phellopilus nigrolimitatus]|nr:hypothetical protein DFH11DRAFT_1514361 [Phellopilus nigrolimitatus]
MAKAYTGTSRRLVIAFDVGTTFSGVSYCLLDPGQDPKICNITRYPGQEHASGSSKIPTVLCYDLQGKLRAAGAEALLPENVEKVEDEEWIKVEWFKLRMRPGSMPADAQETNLPCLPANKILVHVFADFLGYLMSCAENFIRETHLTLSRSWDSMKNDTVFILGHPNGWEGAQQSMMRQAAIISGMIPDTDQGRSRVKFVTEGEASLHYCLREGVLDLVSAYTDNKGFVIADLGGGTLDFSAYKVIGTQPLRVEEISVAKCELQGSTFVTSRAKIFIQGKLCKSRYGSDDHVKQIGERFDETTKKVFRDTSDACVVPFGSIADKDLENGIRSGKLKLSGYEVATFFKPSIAASIAAITDLISESSIPIATVYLVGGFSASPYMTAQIKQHLKRFDICVTSPDGQTAKAVADGAVSFYFDQYVSSRRAKFSYGMGLNTDYNPADPEHQKRKNDGTLVSKETEFRLPFCVESPNKKGILTHEVKLYAYQDKGGPSLWKDQGKPLFKNKNIADSICWCQNYCLVIMFGGTELTAQVAWEENVIPYIYHNRYPGQEHISGSSKIPTVLCYDSQGNLCAAGAEAFLAENIEQIEDEKWIKVEWFKIRMRPGSMPSEESELPNLPSNKILVQVFADFLGYLVTCAEKFIRETHLTLSRSWDTIKNDTVFILGHPNGWEGAQQNMMRQATILAGMIPNTPEGRSRVRFVTEGEASLHYCLREGVLDNLQDKKGFVVADLGGGTLDFSAYKVVATQPLKVEEISAAKCELQGSTFVTARAKIFIKAKLRNSRYGSDEQVKQIGDRFDETTKKIFKDLQDTCLVPFGSIADKDLENGIRAGKLKLFGDEVASFFKPSIAASVTAIVDLINESQIPITTVYLVGGFSASPYVTTQLKVHLERFNISVTCPDGQTAKAVADGAISFYLDQYVTSRIARFSYGMEFSWAFDPSNLEHKRRETTAVIWPSGRKMLPGGFNTALRKGSRVDKETEFRLACCNELTSLGQLSSKTVDLFVYRGAGASPAWKDEFVNKDLLARLCTITADTSGLKKQLVPSLDVNRNRYWRLYFDLIILFGGTELKAQIGWIENVSILSTDVNKLETRLNRCRNLGRGKKVN